MGIIISKRKALFSKVWLEKYRPSSMDDIVMNPGIVEKMTEFIANEDCPSLLLTGSPGTGKTTTAYIIIDAIVKNDTDLLELNGSLFGNIDTVRTTITEFIKTRSFFSKKKIVFIDEADKLTDAAQDSLRNLIEQSSSHISFILTANYIHKISEPLQSRLQTFIFHELSEEKIFSFVSNVLDKECIQYKDEDLRYIVNITKPDVRRCMNEINKAVITSGKDRVLLPENMSNEFLGVEKFVNACLDFNNLAQNKLVTNEKIKNLYSLLDDSADYQRCLEVLAKRSSKTRIKTLCAHFFNTSKDCINIQMHMMEFIGEFILVCMGVHK